MRSRSPKKYSNNNNYFDKVDDFPVINYLHNIIDVNDVHHLHKLLKIQKDEFQKNIIKKEEELIFHKKEVQKLRDIIQCNNNNKTLKRNRELKKIYGSSVRRILQKIFGNLRIGCKQTMIHKSC